MSQRSGSHAKTLLDSLFSNKNPSGSPQVLSSSGTSSSSAASTSGGPHLTPTFRPHKPSSLSSSASASASEDGLADKDASNGETKLRPASTYGEESDEDGSLVATSPPFSSSFKAAQLSMQTLSHYRAPSIPSSRRTSASAASVSDPVAELLSILNDDLIDEEERIDKVRATLANALYSLEGVVSPPSRIDNLVLDLMHRHREDVRPTGASFASLPHRSPSRRPASIRSFSSSRPWTPSRPPFSASSSFSVPASDVSTTTSQQPNSPLFGSAALASLSPASTSTAAPNTGSPRPHPGVIGSGSPRASPRPWNRTLSNLSTTSVASSPGAAPGVSSPMSSLPPGILGNPNSRPASPSPFGSPRLNVAANEFKPRNASSTSLASGAALTPTKPTPLLMRRPSSNASSTNLALANKSHAGAGDDDDDEFSPFGTIKPSPYQPLSYAGYHDYTSDPAWTSAEQSDGLATWPGAWTQSHTGSGFSETNTLGFSEGLNEEGKGDSAAPMTPFDMLYSILVTGTKAGSSEWSPEQVDEALTMHQYDVEQTLNAIWENDGRPLGDGSKSSLSGPQVRAPSSTSDSPRLSPAPLPATAAVRAGVNVLPREALSYSSRLGRQPPGKGGNSAAGPAPALGSGPNRLCRYYLAGECRRSDCKFSHDLENRAVCRYWLKGQCAHNPCNFLHDYEALNHLATGIVSGLQVDDQGSQQPQSTATQADAEPTSFARDPQEDFPELGPGPKQSSSKGSYAATLGTGAADPSKNRWAATLQKRIPSDALSQLQKDSQGIISVHAKGAPSRAASGKLNQRSAPSGSRVSARIPLRAPLLLPTLLTGKHAAQTYQTHRGDSLALAEQRNKLLARASEAYRRGDVASAKQYSKEASSLNHQYEDESRVASRGMLKERLEELRSRVNDPTTSGSSLANLSQESGARKLRGKLAGNGLGICLGVVKSSALQGSSSLSANLSMDERTEFLLDLHGLHSKEAVELTEEFLLGLEAEGMQGLAYLAVGKEKHSSKETDRRRVKVTGFIKQFLSSYAYPFAECDGVLVVDHLSHS